MHIALYTCFLRQISSGKLNYLFQGNKANKETNAWFYGKRLFELIKQYSLFTQA